ncbi:MFS transporter [Cellulomonas fimi]|uniref:Major facilitator superfamily MFS_1 n=1 Tax=Cellulomonas fimi (strain ATCC 484 / DSM 20113 / JCM 1341 / CCUG 24087 / LMG 16345 / NBRC 15513 / NCIMB 8980 / NCTC 7547 / NRS-133) TaxID=590998 RepID=F4GYJ5_CELFA|nr:MFS transporter [Cellulomonas fimi]AEE47112.1 major facilitator superfamily MFS_1 [Cellulomonas fimi ATCC 484]NNH05604.1 MFS transporter [Cellulomonas fimi]VEH35288.1 Bacillibactin exporter [Cellulomonas fimi]
MTNSSITLTPTVRRAGVWQAVLLLAGSCMPVLGSVLLTPILPQLSEEFAAVPGADVLVPMVVAVPALVIALFAPFAGQIVDRLGRKTLLVVAMFAYALAGTAPVWLDDLHAILASRVLVGVCEAAIMTVCTTLIIDYFHEEKRRNTYLGLQTVVTTLAATVFIAVGGALGVSGWHTPFWVYAVGAIIAVPMIVSLWEPSPDAAPEAEAADRSRARVPWRELAFPLVVTLFGGFTFYVLIIEISYLLVGAGVAVSDTRTIGAVAAVASLATACGALAFARVSAFPKRALLSIAFGLQAIGLGAVWAVPGVAGVVVGAIIASAGSGLLLPSLVTWALSNVRFDERGRSTGLWQSAFFGGQFLTPLVMGALAAAVGGLTAAVGCVAVAAAVVGVLVVLPSRGGGQQ